MEKESPVKSQMMRKAIEECRHNLYAFATLINPTYQYGTIHQEVFSWLSAPDANERQLLLLPRGHLKSHCIAVYCVWKITYEPWTTIVYLSSQDDLAKAQLFAIKSMMTSDRYTLYWPEMFKDVYTKNEEGRIERGTWSAYAFDVDHPDRRSRGVRDHTMIIKTVKSNAQGLHCDGLVFDDVVVPQFADTAAGRNELSRALGYFSSILNPGGWVKAVGTRYHPEDSYQAMINAEIPVWNEEQREYTSKIKLWQVLERVVEDSPDRSGTGHFLWPRIKSKDGKSYGFDVYEMAKIKADYMSHQGLSHYYAQYYNDPNDVGTQRIDRSKFQYYDPKFLTHKGGHVYFNNKRLNVFAAMDVAWTESDYGDYTAIAVIGVDSDGYIYILDIERFRTTKFQYYYEALTSLQQKWGFRRMLIESNAGGKLVAQEVESMIRKNGGNLIIDAKHTSGQFGKKQERWAAVLEPKYESKSIFHFRGGNIPILEEEIVLSRSKHDDLKDALTMALMIAKPPVRDRTFEDDDKPSNVVYLNKRFGGRPKSR